MLINSIKSNKFQIIHLWVRSEKGIAKILVRDQTFSKNLLKIWKIAINLYKICTKIWKFLKIYLKKLNKI